ncbi:putative toxin-antitoxin system toxin component, PIN family [Candidatus Poriferisocius sp.]|uniref:putative toxin-antitoxin system toxin component, PIN family n=1 Tax=Candidatus Poriferisocius sp. TaxID=3101276 RepID=UPI003B5C9A00
MKVVLDANVFVSAAIARGSSHRIVQAWLADCAYEVIVCPEILVEVQAVLIERPRMRKWIDVATAEMFIETLSAASELVADPELVLPVTRDRDDDYLISLARSHKADYIVSGDRDLLDWGEQSPPVIAPAAFELLLDTSLT